MVSLAAANEQLAVLQLIYDHRSAVVWCGVGRGVRCGVGSGVWCGVGRECGAVLVGEFGVV